MLNVNLKRFREWRKMATEKMPKRHAWNPVVAGQSLPEEPGVYVLVAGKPLRKLGGKKDSTGILYIGSTNNLLRRWPWRKKHEAYAHHLLGYIAQPNGSSESTLTIRLPKPPTSSEPGDLQHKVVFRNARLFFCKCGKVGEKILHPQGKPGASRDSNWSRLEELLLIKHFFTFGQYPPFNAKSPSIKSIHDHWDWEVWWNWLFVEMEIDGRWDELVIKVNQATKASHRA